MKPTKLNIRVQASVDLNDLWVVIPSRYFMHKQLAPAVAKSIRMTQKKNKPKKTKCGAV